MFLLHQYFFLRQYVSIIRKEDRRVCRRARGRYLPWVGASGDADVPAHASTKSLNSRCECKCSGEMAHAATKSDQSRLRNHLVCKPFNAISCSSVYFCTFIHSKQWWVYFLHAQHGVGGSFEYMREPRKEPRAAPRNKKSRGPRFLCGLHSFFGGGFRSFFSSCPGGPEDFSGVPVGVAGVRVFCWRSLIWRKKLNK